MIQQFLDGESNLNVRTKINTNFLYLEDEIEKLKVNSQVYIGSGVLATYTLSSATSLTATISTTMTTNQYQGFVVELVTSTGENEYAIVASNTTNVFTFDNFVSISNIYTSVKVIDTKNVSSFQTVYACDVRNGDIALVLPKVIDVAERSEIRAFVNEANNGDHKIVVICKNSDTVRGYKYLTLEHKYESVLLSAHLGETNHWDALSIEEVKRFSLFGTTQPLTIGQATYFDFLSFASVQNIKDKRFATFNRDGIFWKKYKSIVDTYFVLSGTLLLTKSTVGTSVVRFALKVKKANGSIVLYDSSPTIVRMTSGNQLTVPICAHVELEKDDEFTLIASCDVNSVVVDEGSSFTIRELG